MQENGNQKLDFVWVEPLEINSYDPQSILNTGQSIEPLYTMLEKGNTTQFLQVITSAKSKAAYLHMVLVVK
jgi:plasmid replication initiation protein